MTLNEQRNTLLNEAQTAIDEGNLEAAEAKMTEIAELDEKLEAINKAKANLAALNGNRGTMTEKKGGKLIETLDETDTDEYKNAFMKYVVKRKPIPAELKNYVTKTTDVGELIPTTTMQKIVAKLENTGVILGKVTRTNFKGGVIVPTVATKPTASWVSEGATDTAQKVETDSITFAYKKLICTVAMTFEVDQLAYDFFETWLVNAIVEAMVKKLEAAIINGAGSSTVPSGILNETPVDGQTVEVAEGTAPGFADFIAMEAALPAGYSEKASYCFNKKFYNLYVNGMTDDNGQPVAGINRGLDGKLSYSLFGRDVIFTDELPNYAASVTEDTVIGFLFNFEDYILNASYDIGIKRFTDNSTDDENIRAIGLFDGKVVDKNSLVTLVIKNA